MMGFGVLLGFRFEGDALGALGAYLLVVAFGLTMCWPIAFLGVAARSPESVNTWEFMIVLPLTLASSVFVPAGSLPGWLEAFVRVNPITAIVDATRGLMLGGPVAGPVVKSVIWLIVITAVFAPLAMARYRGRR